MKSNPSLSDFPAAMVLACEAAIAAKLFYEDEFKAFVFKHMGGFGCESVLIVTLTLDEQVAAKDLWQSNRVLSKQLAAKVVASPRGHYALVRMILEGGRVSTKAYVSDGCGEGLATGGSFDSHDSDPLGQKVLERMIGYEIYQCRKAVEARNFQALCVDAIDRFKLAVGFVHKGAFSCGSGIFSTVVISEVFSESGSVKLHMTKRGSAKRYELTLGAHVFAERANLFAPV
ncbi:hypothetical protein [Rhodoferax antarcticus]|uniref:Uncharacterized protein n=1 Tax=Rhodoferax antarcticus ANT.BR TaxID=1111071 RepID=A0A1Q8Y9C7_9BURK|nr:hypothetical protein [Rhodoferax antarcticus]OLP04480.1 hypothetical protein BLL52_4125 [Rhodoferax antarcticus ANT.BR]